MMDNKTPQKRDCAITRKSGADSICRFGHGVRQVLIAAALLGLGPGTAVGQPGMSTGVITGRVVSDLTNRPLAGARVEVRGTSRLLSTDAEGRFEVSGLAAGTYSVEVRAIGYRPYIQAAVEVGTGKPTTLLIHLTPVPVRLQTVIVEPSYFQRSRSLGAGAETLNAVETRRAPGVQEDVVRAVALLPGVGVTTAGRNDLVVRGGAPFENLFVVDGIEVPNISHFGSQGSTGGPLTLLNPEFIQEASFTAGGFAPRYGDKTASLTNIQLREGNGRRLAGEVNLSATGFGLLAEGPVGSTGSFLFGARRSYLDLLFRAAGFSFVPAYWDGQLKLTIRPDPRNTLSFLMIGAINTVSFDNTTADNRFDNSRILAPEQNQYFSGVTWKHAEDNTLFTLTVGRTFTRFQTIQRDSSTEAQEVFRNESREGENTVRADLVVEPAAGFDLNVGSQIRFASDLAYDVTLSGDLRYDGAGNPAPLAIDTTFTAFRGASYANLGLQVTERLRITAGARLNYYGFLRRLARVAPRAGAQFDVDDASTLTLSVGRIFQAPSYIWLVGDPENTERLEPIRADQVVAGVERRVRPDFKIKLEAYYKSYDRYPLRRERPTAVLSPTGFEDATTDIPFGLEPLSSDATGRAFGLEFSMQKKLSAVPFYGLATISLGQTEFVAADAVTRPGSFDTRLIANTLVGYRVNSSWEVSGKFRVATGLPTTPWILEGEQTGRPDFTRFNGGPRLPAFHALDLRIDRRWNWRGADLELYLDVQNVYGRENVSAVRWNARDGSPEPDESLGVLPSLGVRLRF